MKVGYMKTKKIFLICLILLFSWFIACASGQTTQPQETEPPKENTSKERNLALENIGKDLGFVYAPYGKGWKYKDVSLDNSDFQGWYNKNKENFMLIVNNLTDELVLEVVGHTDASGPQEAEPETGKKGNIWYSTERAKKVYNALINAGIPKEKLKFVGVGESEHIPGVDPYDQSQRRVTFRVNKK